MVGVGKEFFDTGEPPPYTEEVTQYFTIVSFFPSLDLTIEGDSHEGIGVARQVSDRMEKIVARFADGTVDVVTPESEPWRQGGYAVAGDGRMYLFLYEDQQLEANAEQLMETLIGDLTPDGDVAVLRLPKGRPADGLAVLVPDVEADVPVAGEYRFGEFVLGYEGEVPAYGVARGSRGQLDFDGEGGFLGSIDVFMSLEYGGTDSEHVDFSGSYDVAGNLLQWGDLFGVLTPDGSALFSVDLSAESREVALTIALRAPDGAVASAGDFRQASLYHEYDLVKGAPAGGPALFETGHGNFGVRDTFDSAAGYVQHFNTTPFAEYTELGQDLFADASLAVNADGSVSWPAFDNTVMRGSFDATARYLFLVPTDADSQLPMYPTLFFVYRR
jgi:hypothetical protein